MNVVVETQEIKPDFNIKLKKVGIKNLKTFIKIRRDSRDMVHIPRVSIFIDLDQNKKGIHMSRLVESINEIFEEETMDVHLSLEELGKHVLERLKEKHRYKKGEITIASELAIVKKTPISKRNTTEVYDVSITVINNEEYKKKLKVKVVGNTACPHALQLSNNSETHAQRAVGVLEIESKFDAKITLEKMIECVERSFSSPTYSLLKSSDEKHVIKEMYKRPMFVEDVARAILTNAKKELPKDIKIRSYCEGKESIHKHNSYAEVEG